MLLCDISTIGKDRFVVRYWQVTQGGSGDGQQAAPILSVSATVISKFLSIEVEQKSTAVANLPSAYFNVKLATDNNRAMAYNILDKNGSDFTLNTIGHSYWIVICKA